MFRRYRRYGRFRRGRGYRSRFTRRRFAPRYRFKRRGTYALNNLARRLQTQKTRQEAQAFRKIFNQIQKGDSPQLVLSNVQQSMLGRFGKDKRTGYQQFLRDILCRKRTDSAYTSLDKNDQESQIWNSFKAFQEATQQQMGTSGQGFNQQDSTVYKEDTQLRGVGDIGGGISTARGKERSKRGSSIDKGSGIGSGDNGLSTQVHSSPSGDEKALSVLSAKRPFSLERSKGLDPLGGARIRKNKVSLESGPQSISGNGSRSESQPMDGQLSWAENNLIGRIRGTDSSNINGQNSGRLSFDIGRKRVDSDSSMEPSNTDKQYGSKIVVSAPTTDDAGCIFSQSDEDSAFSEVEEQDIPSYSNVQAA